MQSQSSESFEVPKTYADLQRLYGVHIQKLLTRYNKVEQNFEDLHSYVWMKILEARLLERFQDYVERQTPKVLTAIEVCDLLGVSWQQWVQALVASHTGKRPIWMPTPVNEEEFKIQGTSWFSARNAVFAFVDVIQLTFGERIQGTIHWAFNRWGRDVKGGLVLGPSRPEGHLNIPEVRATPSQFRNYLSMAVLNHYANFCRTRKRRHKERPQLVRGAEGDTIAWEDTLVEEKHDAAVIKIELKEARILLQETIQACLVDCGINPGGDEESKIFTQLQEGASLVQALKTSGLPVQVRKSVIRSIRKDSLDGGELTLEESAEE